MPSSEQQQQRKPRVYHVLDVWAIPSDVYKITDKKDRARVIRALIRSSPIKPIGLDKQIAPISFADHAMVLFGLFVCMGGPLIWIYGSMYWLFLGPSSSCLLRFAHVAIVYVVLAFHPLPSRHSSFINDYFLTCRFTVALYKYFTYRFVWTNDALERVIEYNEREEKCFIGAGPPHGVLPFANLLSVPAINAVLGVDFVGTPAPVVFSTPFLRYMTLYPFVSVDKKSMLGVLQREHKNLGVVPDGIAGIFRQSREREVVALADRMGIAKLACSYENIAILPAYSFNNTAVFSSWWDPWHIMERISRKLKASIFFYWGRFYLPIPHRVPITMVFGNLVVPPETTKKPPSLEEITNVHKELLTLIRDLFECFRESVGWKDKELEFV